MIDLPTIVVSQIVGVFVNRAASKIFGNENITRDTLEHFLKILSKDFILKVEEVIKNEFFAHDFDTIKAHLLTAYSSYSRFKITINASAPTGDQTVLNDSLLEIERAYSLFFVRFDRIAANAAAAKDKTATSLRSFLDMIEIAALGLQALATIDIMIASEYMDYHPAYRNTIVKRIEKNVEALKALFEIYEKHHSMRLVTTGKRLFWKPEFDAEFNKSKIMPDKDWVKSNMTFHLYLLDGILEVPVKSAALARDYLSRDAYYEMKVNGVTHTASVATSDACCKSEVAKNMLVKSLAYQTLPPLKKKMHEIIGIWNEAKEAIIYGGRYNSLVNIVENIASYDNAILNEAKESYTALMSDVN